MMPDSDKLEGAVTGRALLAKNLDMLPPSSECEKITRRKRTRGRPKEMGGQGRPDSLGDIFESRQGPNLALPYVVNGRDLKHKIPKGTGKDIRQKFVGGSFARIVIAGRDLHAVIALNAADINIDAAGNELAAAKSIPDSLREE